MPKHIQENEHDERLSKHAAQASSLLASRARKVKDADMGLPDGADIGVRDGGGAGARGNVAGDTPSAKRAAKAVPPERESVSREAYPRNLAEFVRRNIVYIAGVVAVVLVVAVGIVALGALRPGTSNLAETAAEEPAYVSPYDWTKLDRTDGRYRYVVDGEVKSRLGVDVSENQHDIDWAAVAADGIDFAMIRVGYRGATAGDLYLDEMYWANMDGARNAGLDVGAYFFSQASTVEEAIEEADFVLEYLDGTPLAYPIAFDSEEVVLNLDSSRTTGLSSDEMTAIAEAFCKRIEDAGYRAIVYGNAADLARYRYEDLEQKSIWWAEYATPVPAANIDIDYWQYSNSGEVAGIPTAVDMNLDLTRALD